MRPIILATDGSPAAARATEEAIELARAFATEIVVVAVSHLAPPLRPYFGYQEDAARFRRREDDRLANVLNETATAVRSAGVACQTVRPSGPIVDEICASARDRNARTIVVGAHGGSRVRRAFYGSVSAGVLEAAPCPVLVVRGAGDCAAQFEPTGNSRPAVTKEAS